MPAPCDRRRVLLACDGAVSQSLPALFEQPPLQARWDVVTAADSVHARVLLQHNAFDAVLLHEHGAQVSGDLSLSGMCQRAAVPLVYLTNQRPEALTRAYREGVAMCLPRDLTLAHPPLLEAVLDRAARLADEQRHHNVTRAQLEKCRRQIDSLVTLIWRSTPIESGTGWLAQRYLLERLDDELARSERHATPFTLAVGAVCAEEASEWHGGEAAAQHHTPTDLEEWTTTTISRAKRRCDVAGQYGPNRFLLLMVHTPGPGAVTCCRRLQQLLQDCPPFSGPRETVRAYFGLANGSARASSAPALLRIAEESLERARASHDGIAAS